MVSEKQTSIHTGSEGPSGWWVSQAPLRVSTVPDVHRTPLCGRHRGEQGPGEEARRLGVKADALPRRLLRALVVYSSAVARQELMDC